MEYFFQNPSVREKAFFGFDWQFALTDSRGFPDDHAPWRAVQLPHDWSVDYPVDERAPSCGSGGYARTGIGWYRRVFSASVAEDSRYTLLTSRGQFAYYALIPGGSSLALSRVEQGFSLLE